MIYIFFDNTDLVLKYNLEVLFNDQFWSSGRTEVVSYPFKKLKNFYCNRLVNFFPELRNIQYHDRTDRMACESSSWS